MTGHPEETVRRAGAALAGPLRRALLAAVVALALVILLPPATAASAGVDDWVHTWEVVRLVDYRQSQPWPPDGIMVYYLGDSIARESTVSDTDWAGQLARRAARAGKTTAFGFTVAGHNQTFGMDERIVDGLPVTPERQPRGIVLIGVGISRFIGPPTPLDPPALDPVAPDGEPTLSAWIQHRYDGRAPLSPAHKRELAARWMERRWDGFRANRRDNFAAINRLIAACEAKQLRPVLIDLPLNLAAVGHRLDRPLAVIHDRCADIARRNGIRYLRFNRSLGLRSAAYWDLHHLLAPGTTRWQSRLSDELVKLLPDAQPAE
ncbi:MAG: hypothetical protein ACM3MJ_08270 [Deltaproteobacteria bacterium]